MTQEEKQLLLKDLCARLPYGVKVMKQFKSQTRTLLSIDVANLRVYFLENDVNSPFGFNIEDPLRFSQQIKPYLRPMSSMTEEERKELKAATCPNGTGFFDEKYLICPMNHYGEHISYGFMSDILGWLNEHHFDYRGLLEKGLALEAPEGMYKIEKL